MSMADLPKIIAVVGTNASGKSGLGVELALRLNGEIISADSRQVYRGLDLGSGKIAREQMRGVPHHLLDVCEPGEFFSMHDYQKLAYAAIDDILSRGRLPFLVGGTGLYVNCVTEGYVMSDRMPDLGYREELEKLTTAELYDLLLTKLPNVQVDSRNRNRVMRMLEKLHDGDDHSPTAIPRYDCLKLGVTWDRPTLKQRIDERLAHRMAQGMVGEVRGLLESGVSVDFLLKLGLEYRFVTQYLRGEFASEEDMCEELAAAIKRFAKRQMTWFRRDKSIHWLDMRAMPADEAEVLIHTFLEQ